MANTADERRILVVDDEIDNLAFLERSLHSRFKVASAESAEAALDLLESNEFDIVVSDERMPGLNGTPFLTQVLERWPQTIRMLVTGYADLNVTTDAINLAGISGYIVKPFSGEQINAAIDRSIAVHELTVANSRLSTELAAANRLLQKDLTERELIIKETQAQLMLSDRMASLGVLAAGVSHEINNPLAYVMANHSFLGESLRQLLKALQKEPNQIHSTQVVEEALTVLADCSEGTQRILHIVRDLQTFARPKDKEHRVVDIRPILESALNMAWNQLRHRARLVKDFGPTPTVEASETKLAQVFLNLLINAAQAIPEGDARNNEIRVTTGTDDTGNAVVTIHDTGTGITSSDTENIFLPFFTTKPVGEGTGLGLSICHGIITRLGGTIEVASQPGSTTFSIVLPRACEQDADESDQPPNVEPASKRTGGRVLIVDDEEGIARALRRILSGQHEVLTAFSGREALKILQSSDPPDLVLCDLLMPDVSGMDLFEEVTRLAPELTEKFVFMTGSAFTDRARQFLHNVSNRRIYKPFDVNVVREMVEMFIRVPPGP